VYQLFSELLPTAGERATYAAAGALGPTGIIEILNVAGFYGIIASIVNTTGVALRPGQSDPFA
jgi:hypothetical protein